jgi:hypothetical protein
VVVDLPLLRAAAMNDVSELRNLAALSSDRSISYVRPSSPNETVPAASDPSRSSTNFTFTCCAIRKVHFSLRVVSPLSMQMAAKIGQLASPEAARLLLVTRPAGKPRRAASGRTGRGARPDGRAPLRD